MHLGRIAIASLYTGFVIPSVCGITMFGLHCMILLLKGVGFHISAAEYRAVAPHRC